MKGLFYFWIFKYWNFIKWQRGFSNNQKLLLFCKETNRIHNFKNTFNLKIRILNRNKVRQIKIRIKIIFKINNSWLNNKEGFPITKNYFFSPRKPIEYITSRTHSTLKLEFWVGTRLGELKSELKLYLKSITTGSIGTHQKIKLEDY